MDKIFAGEGLGQQKGGISFLTKDQVTRIELTRGAFIMALIKYINGDLWK
jgi:non-canonical (house-cleaning) NTP pyrophosphatase